MNIGPRMAEIEASPVTVADQIQFISLAREVLEKICGAQTKKGKEEYVRKSFQHFRKAFAGTHNGSLDPEKALGDSIFSLVRIILPTEDKSRAPYGMKGTVLARTFVKALGLDENSSDAKKLLYFRDPNRTQISGDLGSVVYSVLQSRMSSVSGNRSPSLADLNGVLDSIAKADGSGVTSEKQVEILKRFIPKLSAIEGKWLARIILKQMGLGLNKHQVFRCIHPQAESLYETTGSLQMVCLRLNDPNAVIDETQVQLFSPFKQMLCARLNVKYDLSKEGKREDFGNLPDPPFLVELKFDGERFQIHYDSARPKGQQFRFFSRSGIDNTANFERTLTHRLMPRVKSSCSSFILDGEMMAYRKSTGGFTHKGQNIDVRRMKSDDPEHCPAFVAFDIVYYNGGSLTNVPLQERLELVHEAVDEEKGVITLSQVKTLNSKELILEELNEAVDDFQEGLIVKQLDSVYEIGKRAQTWLKIKPEYFSENSVDDMDVIILGAYYTDSVRHRGNINHFLVGLLGRNKSGVEEFYPIGRVGTGRMRHPEIGKLIEELKPKLIPKPDTSSTVHLKNFKRPDLYINPKKSVVVQIKAMEILPHEDYAIKFSLRFARIVQVRRDKSWTDILTVQEFIEIQKSYGGKFARRSDGLPRTPKKRPTTSKAHRGTRSDSESPERQRGPYSPRTIPAAVPTTSAKYFVVNNSYKSRGTQQKPRPSPVKFNTFDSKVFRVIGSMNWKKEVEQRIVENGGVIVQNTTKDLYGIIAQNKSATVETLMKAQEHDILKLSWLEKCIESRSIERILPEDCFSAGRKTQEVLSKDFDEYGDHYRTKVSSVDMKRLLEKILVDDDSDISCDSTDHPSSTPMDCLEEDAHDAEIVKLRKYSFMKDVKIAFRNEEELSQDELIGLKMAIQFYGGQVSSEMDESTTHLIVYDANSPIKKQHLSAISVRLQWLKDSLDQRKALDELTYLIA